MAVPSEIPRVVHFLMIIVFYIVGSISLVVNVTTLVIIVRKSLALNKEVKILAIFQQASCLLANAFFTLLFIPFFYPRMGGGYCMGLLCLFVPYQYLMLTFIFLTACMFSAFGMMILVRHQLLIPEDSMLKMRTPFRYAVYVIMNLVMHLWTFAMALSLHSDRKMQNVVMDLYVQIRWRERGLNWFLFYGPGEPAVMRITQIGAYVFAPVVCSCIALPFIHMVMIILKHRQQIKSLRLEKDVHLINAQTIVIQGLVLLIFIGLPLVTGVIAAAQNEVYVRTQTSLVIGEMFLACSTLANSIVLVSRNRTYHSAILQFLRI